MPMTDLHDRDLLEAAAEKLGLSIGQLLLRYYGSLGDAQHEWTQIERSGKLQASFAQTLLAELRLFDHSERQHIGQPSM